jgi:hypothetical protein
MPQDSLFRVPFESYLVNVIAYCASYFLGAFANLRKATISFVISVCPSASNNSVPTGQIFTKFDIRVFFENLSRKFRFH